MAVLILQLPEQTLQADKWNADRVLMIPHVKAGEPQAGRRVHCGTERYVHTDVHHTVYLPDDWKADGPARPIIFEFTGNYAPKLGSTGNVDDAGLGYCLTAGQFIWVCLPYVNQQGTGNERTWWGDRNATVQYAKANVPRILQRYNADPQNVFLCGFSRGAIGVSLIGLHDHEIASLWTAFITHDHFDGVREWKHTSWGSPLTKYRRAAAERLQRIGDRPVLICQHGPYGTREWLQQTLPSLRNIRFLSVDVERLFTEFPNSVCAHPHTDRWAAVPGPARGIAWQWVRQTVRQNRSGRP